MSVGKRPNRSRLQEMKYSSILVAALALCFSACTSVNVKPVPADEKISTVLIRTNSKVKVTDFLDVLVEGFARHGIGAKIVPQNTDVKDEYVVDYVAYRNWDMAPYLIDATIRITKGGRPIAYAEYHLNGKGGLSLMKWEGTKTKIDPLIEQLLSGVQH